MKTTIEKIEKSLANTNEWIITVICPYQGAIIVINNAFTTPISTYRQNSNGTYDLDKTMDYNDSTKAPLIAMINAHNNSDINQKEAEKFRF